MANQPPTRPAYEIPGNVSAHAALDAAHAAHKRLGRAMVVTVAAAVRDILTGHEPDAPFDAAGVELVEGAEGNLFPSGRYWTTAGIERTFTEAVGETEAEAGIYDMSEWTAYLDDDTRDVWRPLCSQLDDCEGQPAYRLNLIRAAALTLDPPMNAASPVTH